MGGLYIHIPFCGQRCAYCDFYSTFLHAVIPDYLEAVKREMTTRRDFLADGRLDTVYVGGGTPSLLAPEQLQGLLAHAATLWDCSRIFEVTLEANPEDLTDKYLSQLTGTGFNRLSIGVQSFDDDLLLKMNRRHSATRAKNAVQAAQNAGFDNISIDLIFGIPGMTDAQWERTLDEALALGIQHISAYHLTIEPGTAFWKMFGVDETHHSVSRSGCHPSTGGESHSRPVTETESERQYEILRQKLGDAGFEHYEISNFALPGRRAVHNSSYWSGKAYLGVGPSAHSFDGRRRREWVVPDVKKYIAGSGTDNIYEGESLSDVELFNEKIMTALRTSKGIDRAELHSAGKIEKFLRDGLLVERDGKIAIPPKIFLLSDFIISELFEVGN